jgi:probable F420-dependent oxidoreductase
MTPGIGVHPCVTDRSMPLLDLARATETRGLAAIYLPEHTHIPVATEGYPGGGPMPERYARVLDPFIAGAWIAASTTLEIGTAVALPAEHDAIALAKAVSTLDFLSEGRLVLGVGAGWNRQEAEDHGIAGRDRWAAAEDAVRLMRSVWTEDRAAYEGSFVRLSPSYSWPKPHRQGGPPLLVGGLASDHTFRRVVAWADGWIPLGHAVLDEPGFDERLAELRRRWEGAGRDPAALELCAFFLPGPSDEVVRVAARASKLGVQRIQVFLEDRPADEALPILDELAKAVEVLR